ncbi:MAG: phage tail protein [Tannerellaceae bacterium]|nr:phage tail protein [Tannerellaceae bacterium]
MMGIELPFKEVSGLSVEIEQEMVVEGGLNTHVHRLSKQMKHANLVLKGALKPVNSLHVLWIKTILEGSLLLPILPIPISVTLLNAQGSPSYHWLCANAYPVKWDIEPLDSEKNSVLIESLEFSYSTITRF